MIVAPTYDPALEPICYDWGYTNLFTRLMHFQKAGGMHAGHCHTFPHPHVVLRGGIRLFCQSDADWVHKGDFVVDFLPLVIVIEAKVRHFLVALHDNTLSECRHAHRTGPGICDILPAELTIDGEVPPDVLATLYPMIDIDREHAARRSPFD